MSDSLELLRRAGRVRILVPPRRPSCLVEIPAYPVLLEMDTMELVLQEDRPAEAMLVLTFGYRGLTSFPVAMTYQVIQSPDHLRAVGWTALRDTLQDGRAKAH